VACGCKNLLSTHGGSIAININYSKGEFEERGLILVRIAAFVTWYRIKFAEC
jgi:hypothetical protein